jgi:hypothetical protein
MSDHEDQRRTDIHRRGAFQPEFYEFFGWYYLGGRGAAQKVDRASKRIENYLAGKDEFGIPIVEYKAMVYGDFGKCGVCGARFALGEIWMHKESKDLLHIGCDCTRKYRMVSGTNWTALTAERDRALKAARSRARNEKNRAALLAATPGLAEALEVDHNLARSFKWQFEKNAFLSEKQISIALSLPAQVKARDERRAQIEAERAAEVKIAAPTGRVVVRGVIVSIKEHEGAYGITKKMTVKVKTAEGVWLAWGTLPNELVRQFDPCNPGTVVYEGANVGDEVEFKATLVAGREPHFVFAKRPVKARVVKTAEVKVAS